VYDLAVVLTETLKFRALFSENSQPFGNRNFEHRRCRLGRVKMVCLFKPNSGSFLDSGSGIAYSHLPVI
jgi:hypothetical protein